MKKFIVSAAFFVSPTIQAAAITCSSDYATVDISENHKSAQLTYEGKIHEMVCREYPQSSLFACQTVSDRNFRFLIPLILPGDRVNGTLKEDIFSGGWTIGKLPCLAKE